MSGDIESKRRELTFKIIQGDISLLVEFVQGQILFLEHMKAGPDKWLNQQLLQIYAVKIDKAKWIFENRFVLSQVNHTELIKKLKNHLERYEVHQVLYDAGAFSKQIMKMTQQLEESQQIIKFREAKQLDKNIVQLLSLKSSRDLIETQIDRLKEFKKDTLIYPLDDYLSKTKLKANEFQLFVEGMLRHYTKAIKISINKRLKHYDLSHELSIENMYSYEKDQKTKIKYGVVFDIIGHPTCYGKFYQFFENWLMKLNWMILQVSQIVCCRKENIEQWIYNKKKIKAFLITPNQAEQKRVVVISPRKYKTELQKLLQTSTRMITGKDFPPDQFQLVYRYSKDFKIYLASSKGIIFSDLRVYQDYIMVDCEASEEDKIRRRIRSFLETYKEQEHLVREFKTDFDMKIFGKFYLKMIKSSPITYHMENGQLYRTNSNKIEEQASMEIGQIFKVMRKQLVDKPLNKKIPNIEGLFNISKAPAEWQTAQCLQSKRFRLTDKIDICLRSYGSIQNSETDGIFVVNDLSKCSELRDILKGQGALTTKFQQNLMKNKVMTRPLKYCKYFETITMWVINKDHFNQRRNSFAYSRLKNQIQNILKVCGNLMHLKIVLPSDSQSEIQIFLPYLLQALINSCNFGGQGRIELTLYTSCNRGYSLRGEVMKQLRKFTYRGQNKVQKVSDMELRIEDIEKIIEFNYYELKYFDQDEVTRSVSPLNSYVFHRQFAKKLSTPIFLLSQEEIKKNKLSEFLICYFDKSIHEVKNGRVYKLPQKYTQIEQFCKAAELLKTYFKQLDYAVFYGSIDKEPYSRKLCYTSDKQSMYKKFQELYFLTKDKKVMCKNNSIRISYQVVQNKFIELFQVETHPDMLDQLQELKRGHSLMN